MTTPAATLPRLLVLHVMLAGVCGALWQLGLFSGFPVLSYQEHLMVALLVLFAAGGVACVAVGRRDDARFISNTLPIVALLGTVLGLELSGAHMSGTPEGMIAVFRAILTSLSTNLAGVAGMVWLHVLLHATRET